MNINQSKTQTQVQDWSDKIQEKIREYLFDYPERDNINIHESVFDKSNLLYIRLVSLIYLSAIFIWTLTQMPSFFYIEQYLTLFGYFLTWLYFMLTIQDYFLNYGKAASIVVSGGLKNYIQIIYEMALCFEFPITIVFWTVLLRILLNTPEVTADVIIVNANLHAGPLVCLLIDFSHNLFSFHDRHLPVLIIFSAFYFVLNLVYSLEVKPVYPPIDWVSVLSYIITILAVTFVLLVHFLGRIIYRKWKKQKIGSHQMIALLISQQDKQEGSVESQDSKQNQIVTQSIGL